MRKIAVLDDFLTSDLKKSIGDTAARLGFFVDYFEKPEDVVPVVGNYEIFFGHSAQAVLAAGRNL